MPGMLQLLLTARCRDFNCVEEEPLGIPLIVPHLPRNPVTLTPVYKFTGLKIPLRQAILRT